jgi:hypothetical protein
LSVWWLATDFRHSDQTGSGAHPASYPTANGLALSLEVKWPEHKAYHPLPRGANGKNVWRCTSISTYVLTQWCLMKHRDNFTFIFTSPLK